MATWRSFALFAVTLCGAAIAGEKAFVYAAVGSELRSYELDLASATLSARGSVTLPADIQAGSVHPSGRYVFVAWSDGTNVSSGSRHGLSAYRIERAAQGLVTNGTPVPLPSRPIYVSTDPAARHALVAYTSPSGVTVHALASDGTIAPPITQAPMTLGIYGHQILVDPKSTMAIFVARGNVPTTSRAEDPGALDVLEYADGRLSQRAAIAPDGGFGFHPRYLDFHPSRPWVFVSLSQQNEIGVYEQQPNGTLSARRLFARNSLADPGHVRPGQLSGALHVHPNGRFVYVANRAVNAQEVDGKAVFSGGENSIAVFALERTTGEPVLIQTVAAHGMGPAEFAFAPGGRLLVLGNMKTLWIGDAGSLRPVPPNLAIFEVREDGKLDFIRTCDVDAGDRTLFWMAIGPAP